MSMMTCTNCDHFWDSDFYEVCPHCEIDEHTAFFDHSTQRVSLAHLSQAEREHAREHIARGLDVTPQDYAKAFLQRFGWDLE